jgi:hypothetical protein
MLVCCSCRHVLCFSICVFFVSFVLVFSPAGTDAGTFSQVVRLQSRSCLRCDCPVAAINLTLLLSPFLAFHSRARTALRLSSNDPLDPLSFVLLLTGCCCLLSVSGKKMVATVCSRACRCTTGRWQPSSGASARVFVCVCRPLLGKFQQAFFFFRLFLRWCAQSCDLWLKIGLGKRFNHLEEILKDRVQIGICESRDPRPVAALDH